MPLTCAFPEIYGRISDCMALVRAACSKNKDGRARENVPTAPVTVTSLTEIVIGVALDGASSADVSSKWMLLYRMVIEAVP
jgi:hypothetical protein